MWCWAIGVLKQEREEAEEALGHRARTAPVLAEVCVGGVGGVLVEVCVGVSGRWGRWWRRQRGGGVLVVVACGVERRHSGWTAPAAASRLFDGWMMGGKR